MSRSTDVAARVESRAVRLGVIALLLLGAVVGVVVVSPSDIVDQLASSRETWLVLAVLAGAYLVRPLVLVPMSAITIFVGFRYGVVVGFPIALLGTAVTTLPPYLLANRIRTDEGPVGWLARPGRRAVHVTGEFRGVVAARLLPAPADAVSYGAGVSNVSVAAYVAGTAVGELPWTAAYLLIGASLHRLAVDRAAIDWRFVAGMTVISGLLLARPVYQWLTAWRRNDAIVDRTES